MTEKRKIIFADSSALMATTDAPSKVHPPDKNPDKRTKPDVRDWLLVCCYDFLQLCCQS